MTRSSYGSSVVDRTIQYFSASSLTLGDSDSADGCLRKWYYEKVEGKKFPSTVAQGIGTKLHAEIESYLRTGVNELGPLAARGKPMIPDPGPDLMIEHDIMLSPGVSTTEPKLEDSPLRILDIPVVGYIDLLHGRCTNKGVSDIEDIHDPEGTIEVIDWKTTSKTDYIKTPDVMARTIQMTVYGKWVTTVFPDTSYVRLSHGYFVTRGSAAPRKVTLRLLPEQIDRQWERVERVAGSIVDAAQENNADKVPANTRACDAYGGCPHRTYCRASTQEALTAFFGPTGADHMIRRLNKVTATSMTTVKDDDLQAELIRVGREEIEAKYPGLPAVWDELESCKVGNPQYAGALAAAVGSLRGQIGTVTTIAGSGELATFGPFSDPTDLPGLLEEVKAYLTPGIELSPPPIELSPPSVELSPPVVELLPPDAPASDPVLASEPPPQAPTEAPAKRGRGRPRKVAAATDITPPVIYDINTGQAVMTFTKVEDTPMADVAVPPIDDKIYFYVNCSPSRPFETFWPAVHELLDDLNKASEPALDFRLVPSDHKFAYGRWKAAITAAFNSCELPPGHYVLNGVGGEIGMAVVEAMRIVVAARGGIFIQ